MCNGACIRFVFEHLNGVDLSDKSILEIGSYNVNGSCSFELKKRNPLSYIGIDMQPGPCVDEVCNVYDIVRRFGEEAFDIVISTEMLEHVRDWRLAINNMKKVCKVGGQILLTTRSYGFPLHGYPEDFWRFETKDMGDIFADCDYVVQKDTQDIGVFVYAKKKSSSLKDLSMMELYNILENRRTI